MRTGAELPACSCLGAGRVHTFDSLMKLTNFAFATSGVYLVASSSMVSSKITADSVTSRNENEKSLLFWGFYFVSITDHIS